MNDTKQRILDTAERLIADQGYAGTSLRHIIAEAGVNLASVHYHFGSKNELLHELVMRKAGPVNEKRIELLEQAEAEAAPAPPSVETVLKAFLEPMAEAAQRNRQFVRVMGRLIAEGLLPEIVEKNFQPTGSRFFAVLRRALPDLPEQEFLWRTQFMIGAMAHTMCGKVDSAADFPARIGHLTRFLAGGFLAPVAVPVPVEVEG